MKIFRNDACEVIPRHELPPMLLRGVAGIALMAWSFSFLVPQPMLGWTMLAVSVLLLKGCPTCWGIQLVNLVRARGIARRQADAGHSVDIAAEYKRLVRARRRDYHPTDMAAHLFPPEDVERFHRDAAECKK